MLLLYFKRITRQNIFFTIISLNKSDKTNFIVTFVNTSPIFNNSLNINPCFTLYSLTTFRYNTNTTILNEVMFMAKRYENMDNVSTKINSLFLRWRKERKQNKKIFLS